jgi:hypothetical protein
MNMPLIDPTMLRSDTWGDDGGFNIESAEHPLGDAIERNRARAVRVVGYVRWRIPPLRDGDAPVTAKRELL